MMNGLRFRAVGLDLKEPPLWVEDLGFSLGLRACSIWLCLGVRFQV